MAFRSGGRNLSFEALSRNSSLEHEQFHRSNSDSIRSNHNAADDHKPRRKRNKKKRTVANDSIPESPPADTDANAVENEVVNGLGFNYSQTVLSSVTTELSEPPSRFGATELRQRSVNASAGGALLEETTPSGALDEANSKEESGVETAAVPAVAPVTMPNGVPKLQNAESLDWQRLMAEDPNYMYTMDKSPLKYFMEEMSNGNSLRSTTTLGNEKERERVYDTIFRLPWRCELLINVGFFVCFDSFLSLLTIMPARILMTLWRLVRTSLRGHLQQSFLISGVLR